MKNYSIQVIEVTDNGLFVKEFRGINEFLDDQVKSEEDFQVLLDYVEQRKEEDRKKQLNLLQMERKGLLADIEGMQKKLQKVEDEISLLTVVFEDNNTTKQTN